MIQTPQDYLHEIDALWTEYLFSNKGISDLLSNILNCSYSVPADFHQSDLVVAGINPSYDSKQSRDFRKGERLDPFPTPRALNKDRFWDAIVRLVPEKYRPTYAHVDLFVLRKTEELGLLKMKNENDLMFLSRQLFLTQQLLENVIRPKLIVVANKVSWHYWSYRSPCHWLGYTYKDIREIRKNVFLAEIEGLDMDKTDMVTPPELREERRYLMKGTKVLFARYQSYGCPAAERITAEEIQSILEHECM